jgi:pimeloyl-ACP methyl ester carboxylesterase
MGFGIRIGPPQLRSPAPPERREMPLPLLGGERFAFNGLSFYVAGQGPPLLLIHGVGVAASAAQVRPLFDQFRTTRTVFALDLPGFGFSDRSDRDYTPRVMTDAIHTAISRIHRHCGPVPVDALALSLGCEFLARAAVESPATFGGLALVSPTGLDGRRVLRERPGTTCERTWLRRALGAPDLGPWVYRQLARPTMLRRSLMLAWGRELIDEAQWDSAVQTTRMPGAFHAPLQFLSGRLHSADIHAVYERLTQPVWMSHGVRGDARDYRAMQGMPKLQHWRRTSFDAGAMPHVERPQEFAETFERFLRQSLPEAVAAWAAARR